MSTVDQFNEFLRGNPLQRTNRYRLKVVNPQSSGGVINFYAENVTIPGRQIATLERRGFGTQREHPYEHLYSGDLEFSLVMTNLGHERDFFEKWMNSVVGHHNGSFESGGVSAGRVNSSRAKYTTTCTIELLDEMDAVGSSIEFFEVFPKSIGTVAMSQSEIDNFGILPISLSFRYFEWKTSTPTAPTNFNNL